jgi:hypothetical protein
MGDLADVSTYDIPTPIGGEDTPQGALPLWASQAQALSPDRVIEPQTGMWPNPPPVQIGPPAPPNRPNPLTPFSAWRADPPRRTAGTVMGDLAASQIPTDPLSIGLAVGTGGASIPIRMGATAVGAALQPSDAEAGASGAAKLVKGIKAALKANEALGGVLSPGNIPGTIDVPVLGPSSPINAPYISNPQRVANPGIYKRPDVIAAEAAARVEPEHPALKQLFGVTRQDLYDISQQGRRQGNMETELWQPKRPGAPNEAALSIMNPANEQRILDTLAEARKYPGLEQGMVPWYVMDPMYQRMVELVGPERAAKEYMDFNMSVTPFSAGSSVPSEINRGTAANMMRQRGEYDIFKQYGGIAVPKRGADYPDALRDVKGMMGHLNQANPVERYFRTGSHGYGDENVKINLYSGASGVPQTGFQTTGAVPDAHFTRAIGLPDARKNPNDFNEYMQGTEYRQIGPWYRNKIANPLGIEAVPAQALMWGTYGPQTGVKTKIGAGKLELMSKQMWERAQKLGIDPYEFRDQVLRGEQHSELENDNRSMGSLAAQNYA